jgi:hypothetical protein
MSSKRGVCASFGSFDEQDGRPISNLGAFLTHRWPGGSFDEPAAAE